MSGMSKAAVLSECGRYRYSLTRSWAVSPHMIFVMLNPSTADADIDDPTIRRCNGFAQREGFGGIKVINLFALRATDPRELFTAPDCVGPKNEQHIHDTIIPAKMCGDKIVCAWGAHKLVGNRATFFKGYAASNGVDLYCLGKSKDGHPRHPLYLNADTPLEPLLPEVTNDG